MESDVRDARRAYHSVFETSWESTESGGGRLTLNVFRREREMVENAYVHRFENCKTLVR